MKKKLDIGNITNELEGASLFFTKPAAPPPMTEPEKAILQEKSALLPKSTVPNAPTAQKPKPKIKKKKVHASNFEGNRDSATPPHHDNMQASNNASMHASNHSVIEESIIETIRKAVKDVGKDSATYRFTPEEKKALLELTFSFKMQGYKTSENELARIAINFLLEDQKENGRNSVLQRVLEALSK